MTKMYAAGQFYQKALDAMLKNVTFVKGKEILNFSEPNVFYYIPSIFTQVNKHVLSSLYDSDLDMHDLIEKAKVEYAKTGKLTEEANINLVYQPRPIKWYEDAFKLKLQIRLFDQNATLLTEYTTGEYLFGQPFPNKGYLIPFTKIGNEKFYGISLILPELKEKSYYLDIIETYDTYFGMPLNPIRNSTFTRKLKVPFTVGDKLDWSVKSNKEIFDTVFSMDRFYLNKYDYASHKIDDPTNLANLSEQSVILNYVINVPRLVFDPNFGIYTDYYGNVDDLITNLKNNKEFTITTDKELLSLLKKINSNSATRSLTATMFNAHFNLTKELDHNGLGSRYINVDYLYNNQRSKLLADEVPIIRHDLSHYDFEECFPKFTISKK